MGGLERQVEVRFEWTRTEGWKEESSENGDWYGSENASRRSGVALKSSKDPSFNSLPDGDGKAKWSSVVEGTQSGLGLIPWRSMKSVRSRSPRRPGSITTSETGGRMTTCLGREISSTTTPSGSRIPRRNGQQRNPSFPGSPMSGPTTVQ